MCGITGFLDPRGLDAESGEILARMVGTLRHRGPDDDGGWLDAGAGIALGHRRLSIIDLSPLGHQPMHSADGRWVIVYNGEIYNFATLRRELESAGHAFRSHSDTEVILAGLMHWGFERTLSSLAGMFAVAKSIEGLLFGVRPLDPVVVGAVAIVLAIVAVVATLLPARRAARVHPTTAING